MQSATVSIVMRGPIDESWVDYFGDLVMSSQVQNGRIGLTTMTGTVPDLAAFIGLIMRVQNRDQAVLSAHYDCVSEVAQESSTTESEPS